jgi:hypothetical protein
MNALANVPRGPELLSAEYGMGALECSALDSPMTEWRTPVLTEVKQAPDQLCNVTRTLTGNAADVHSSCDSIHD